MSSYNTDVTLMEAIVKNMEDKNKQKWQLKMFKNN